jgi:1-acyl-sn-glycerol-3-phosphate acyltransferase
MVRRIYLLGRVGLAGLAFLSFWVGGLVVVAVCVPLARLRHWREPPMARAAACQRWIQRAFVLLHAYMRVCGLLHFDPRATDRRSPGPRFVMVANHPTLVDVTAIAATFGRVTCIAKTALFRTPIVGTILRACAYLDGGSGDAFAGGRVVGQALDRLAQEMPVLIFPEGTRSPEGGLRPFKRGAFEIACRAGVPVLPLLIRCEPPALGKGRPWYDIPPRTAYLTVTPLPTLHPGAFAGDAARMTRACEATYRQALNLPTEPLQTANE